MHAPRKKWQGVAVFRAHKCPCASVAKCCAFYVFRNYEEMAASFECVVNKFQETANIPTTSLGLVCWSNKEVILQVPLPRPRQGTGICARVGCHGAK
jgi:hypothetical protein